MSDTKNPFGIPEQDGHETPPVGPPVQLDKQSVPPATHPVQLDAQSVPPATQPTPPETQPSSDEGQALPPPPVSQPIYPDIPPPPQGAPAAMPQEPQAQTLQPQTHVDEPVRHRVHHSYVWLSGLGTAVTVTMVILFSAFMGIIGEGVNIARGATPGAIMLIVLGVILLVVILAGIIMGIQTLAYRNLSYEIGPEEFSVYSGIITKRKIHVPYQRIQSVNQKASLLQRIFGVCTVNIDTAGGSTNKAVVVPYVRKSEAERLRTELFARKQMILSGQSVAQAKTYGGAQAHATASTQAAPQPAAPSGAPITAGVPAAPPASAMPATAYGDAAGQSNILDTPANVMQNTRGFFGGDAFLTGKVTFEYGMSNKELILTGLTNNTGFAVMVFALIGGVISIVSQVLQTGIGQNIVNQGVNWALGAFAGNAIIAIVIGVFILLAGIWLFSIIGTLLSYGGFKARRRDTRIEVERGLLQHQFHGVDIDRVQSVIIKQGFIRRVFGYCELSLGKIDAISGGEASEGQQAAAAQQGLVIHPFVKLNRVSGILYGLVPEFADVPTEEKKLPKVSLRRAFIRRCILHGSGFLFAVIVAVTQIILNTLIQPQGLIESLSATTILTVVNTICTLLYILCAVILLFEIIGTVLWYRHSGFAYNRSFMKITNGGFSQESISFPRKKIQFGTIRSNPFQRRSHVATISARTAAGISGTTIRLLDVHEDEANAWLDWVIPGGNR